MLQKQNIILEYANSLLRLTCDTKKSIESQSRHKTFFHSTNDTIFGSIFCKTGGYDCEFSPHAESKRFAIFPIEATLSPEDLGDISSVRLPRKIPYIFFEEYSEFRSRIP